MEKVLPRGANEWERVTNNYNVSRLLGQLRSRPERDQDSCKAKYKTLKNVKKPTGDPHIPSNVKRTKEIQKEIEKKMSTLDLDDEECEDDEKDEVDEESLEAIEVSIRVLMEHAFNVILQDEKDDATEVDEASAPVPVPTPALKRDVLASRVTTTTISQSTAKRARLDAKIESAEKDLVEGRNMMMTYLIEQGDARRQERVRQDLREADRERREAEREKREEQRELERIEELRERRRFEDDRQRRQDERDERNMQLFTFAISAATKALDNFMNHDKK